MARPNWTERWADVSLRAKITGVTVFILFLGLIVAGVGTLAVLQPMLNSNQTQALERLRNDPTNALRPFANVNGLEPEDITQAPQGYYVAQLDENGDIVRDNTRDLDSRALPTVPDGLLTIDAVVQRYASALVPLHSGDGTKWNAVVKPISVDGQVRGTLLIASSTAPVTQTVAQYIIIFTGFGIAVILLGAALTRLLVTATFLPLAEVERTALEIARGDYSKRIMISSPHTEVGHLGQSLNIMLDRLDGSLEDRSRTIERMRRFIGDASHELRTPLVSVRGYAELYRMGALQEEENVAQAMERIEKEAIRMTSLVEDLLALARLDERRALEIAPLPLNQLATDAALDARAQAPDREVTVITDPTEPAVIGDEHKVRQLMTNLLGNAMRHTPSGSPIELVVSSPVSGGDAAEATSASGTSAAATPAVAAPFARFEIVDHGEGVPEQIRDKIFGRFWRADTSRNRETGGSGLGLAIVKSIVDAHGGSVSVHETAGGGATFRVDLPSAPPSDDTVPIRRLPA
ncbi:sensor histidine kinase [Leucobacter sp. USHLN153]|uniref:sensor histidine kinase n=1 Tax=Leucobacter sp. USHLN153 TaxID=3081268 RepID=UPI003017F0AD